MTNLLMKINTKHVQNMKNLQAKNNWMTTCNKSVQLQDFLAGLTQLACKINIQV